MRKVLRVIGIIIAAIIVIAVIYVANIYLAYSRIDDYMKLSPTNNGAKEALAVGSEYEIVTQNIGFGAYTPDFTFFMDGGTESWAKSADSVRELINLGADKVGEVDPDFVLFQEVDIDSTRSYHIDEEAILADRFDGYSYVSAVNYHSAFLPYPIIKPHGFCNGELLTLSKYDITDSMRRSLEISNSFSKLLDLDRCYSVSRIPVDNGKELLIYNVHLSAYGSDAELKSSQVRQLMDDMLNEYNSGNYCVCGGDFNCDFTGTSLPLFNNGITEYKDWVYPFPEELIPDGIVRCRDYSCGEDRCTVRDCDLPYEEGNFTAIVDGFFVSDNVEVTYLENIQAGFEYSDHNPVTMRFVLQ